MDYAAAATVKPLLNTANLSFLSSPYFFISLCCYYSLHCASTVQSSILNFGMQFARTIIQNNFGVGHTIGSKKLQAEDTSYTKC